MRGPLRTDVKVLRSEIDEIEAAGLSMMPEGLEAGLSVGEVAGLLVFLKGE